MLMFSSAVCLVRRILPLSTVLLLACGVAARAGSEKQTVCCRTSGGTRGGGLSLWVHLVPPSNRFNPGSASQAALLQGTTVKPAGLTVRLLTMKGQLTREHHLEPGFAGVTVLTLPPQSTPTVWESFPTDFPERPPTRSVIDRELPPIEGPSRQMMGTLADSCGGSVETAALLRAFDLESIDVYLPSTLPVRCEALSK